MYYAEKSDIVAENSADVSDMEAFLFHSSSSASALSWQDFHASVMSARVRRGRTLITDKRYGMAEPTRVTELKA